MRLLIGYEDFTSKIWRFKKEFYTRDLSRSFTYNINFDFYQAQAANWRDTIYCSMAPCPPNPAELPEV